MPRPLVSEQHDCRTVYNSAGATRSMQVVDDLDFRIALQGNRIKAAFLAQLRECRPQLTQRRHRAALLTASIAEAQKR